jgi:hypothetical protein
MLIEPSVEVNDVVNQAPSQPNWRWSDLPEKGRTNSEIFGGFLAA